MSVLTTIWVAANTARVPFELLRAICTVESNLDHMAINKYDGNSASHGLCQVKYATAKSVGYSGDVKGLYKANINALYAGKYLKYQLDRYKGDWIKAVSAYNRGTASRTNLKYVRKVFQTIIPEVTNVRSRCEDKKHPCCPGEFYKKIEQGVRY